MGETPLQNANFPHGTEAARGHGVFRLRYVIRKANYISPLQMTGLG